MWMQYVVLFRVDGSCYLTDTETRRALVRTLQTLDFKRR